MPIIFGWYSWLLKRYTFEELGLPLEKDFETKATIEVRQKCFHLLYIPLFSIGKTYAIRKDGKLYKLPSELQVHIEDFQKHKTPWYAFSGLILLALIILISLF